MLNIQGFLFNESELYHYPPRNLEKDVVNNLAIFAICTSKPHPNPPDSMFISDFLSILSTISQSVEPILMDEVTGTLPTGFDVSVP